MDFRVDFDDAGRFAAHAAKAGDYAEKELAAAGMRARPRLQHMTEAQAPVDSGRLRRGIQTTLATGGGFVLTATSTAPHSRYVIEGRGPIVARGRALRFKPKGSGTFIFRKSVGPAAANPFMERAFKQFEPVFRREIETARSRIVAFLGGWGR